tara:strand:- start:348 stop:1034 length:687 start_codon:yes stop_codon:yes gene_type:complete
MVFNPAKLKYDFKEFIGIYENAFTPKECKDTIDLFEKYHKSGYTYSRLGEHNNVLIHKDDASLDVFPTPTIELDWDPVFIRSFHDRFYNIIYPLYSIQYPILQSLIKHKSRLIKVQKTAPTQGYHIWHNEHNGFPHATNRVLSWILYLNDVEEGGETEFLYQSLRFKPKAGTFVLFPAAFTHVHRGNPPLSGAKYIATGWIEFMNTDELQGLSKLPDLSEVRESNIAY